MRTGLQHNWDLHYYYVCDSIVVQDKIGDNAEFHHCSLHILQVGKGSKEVLAQKKYCTEETI